MIAQPFWFLSITKFLPSISSIEKSLGTFRYKKNACCFEVSHGYSVPCDEAGEDCPISATLQSGHKERVLHIHQTPRGKEHVAVEMLPIHDSQGKLFVLC